MKKVLLATTMLVAGASIAAAEVTISGDARMGIINNFVMNPANPDPTTFTSRARVTFTLSGESDSGLSFGGSFRADNAAGAAAGTAGSVFISGAFGRLSMGDVDGAAAAAMGHVDGVGLTGLDDLNESLFIANGAGVSLDALSTLATGAPFASVPGATEDAMTGDPSVLYEYSAGALSIYASATLPGYVGAVDTPFGFTSTSYEGEAYAIGVAYTIDNYKVALGYEKLAIDFLTTPGTADAAHIILGADATFGAFTAKLRYGQADIDANNVLVAELEQLALSGTYTMDALGVTGFYSTQHSTTPAGGNLSWREAYGIGASYDLGGGATVRGGIVQQETQLLGAAPRKDNAFDLGVSFTF